LLFAASALLAGAFPVYAQRAAGARRVALISGGEGENAPRYLSAFKDGMKQHGYQEGRDYELAVRYYGSERSRIPALVDELIAWRAEVIVASISSTAAVVKKRTSTIPIVMVTALDAVAEGLVESLARPGGNLTGMTGLGPAQHAKLVDITHELLPGARRIALVCNPGAPLAKENVEAAASAAKVHSLQMVSLDLSGAAGLDRFAKDLLAARADALVVATDGVLFFQRDAIVQAAFKARIPTIALLAEFVGSGAVATLGHDIKANFRNAARYVDRILKGAKPADLPVEQPIQFELVLNLKSARMLGVTIPPALMVRADRLVQ